MESQYLNNMEILEFIFSSFWTWLGCMIILYVPFDFIFKMYNRTLRHWNIRKHGYPPSHCDADGDFQKIDID
jgi:hypothetical protein